MTRQSAITLDDVRQGVYACLTACEAPSADRLLAHLKRGSKTTVLKYRDQVVEEIRNQLQGHALPSGMPETLQAPMAALWQVAQETAFERLAEERAALQQQGEATEQAREAALAQAAASDQERARIHALAEERQALIEALRIEQAREREVMAGQEQHYVRVIEEVRAERDGLNKKLEAQARQSEQRVQALSKALAEQQRGAMRTEVELVAARGEVERLREETDDCAKALATVQVREQVAVEQRDQALLAEQRAQEAERELRRELDELRDEVAQR